MESSTNIRAARQLLVPSTPSETAIVMYHYVRPLEGSRFPRIHGRSVDEFARQLDWLSERFLEAYIPVAPAGFEPATHGLGNRRSIP